MKIEAEILYHELIQRFHDQSDHALEDMKDIFRKNLEQLQVNMLVSEEVLEVTFLFP